MKALLYSYPIGCALNRRELRKAYNIDGNFFTDCLLYCACYGPCLAGQEYIEASYRKKSVLY